RDVGEYVRGLRERVVAGRRAGDAIAADDDLFVQTGVLVGKGAGAGGQRQAVAALQAGEGAAGEGHVRGGGVSPARRPRPDQRGLRGGDRRGEAGGLGGGVVAGIGPGERVAAPRDRLGRADILVGKNRRRRAAQRHRVAAEHAVERGSA